MIKVVLDTNVVVSAFLSPSGKPADIIRLALNGSLTLCINTPILVEYEQVLMRSKFTDKIHNSAISRFFDIINDIGESIVYVPSKIHMIDESDRCFFDVAKNAGAILITGNKKHFPNEMFVKTPAEFLTDFS